MCVYEDYHWHDGFPRSTLTLTSDCLNLVETFALRQPCKAVRTSQTVLVSVVKGAPCTHEVTLGRTCSRKDRISPQHRHILHKLCCTEPKSQTPSKHICSSKLNPTAPDFVFTAGTWTWAALNCLEIEFWHLTSMKNGWGHLIEKFKRFCQCVFFFFPSHLHSGWEKWAALNYQSELKTQKYILVYMLLWRLMLSEESAVMRLIQVLTLSPVWQIIHG